VPTDSLRLSRRAALRTAAVVAGLSAVLAGCDDEPHRESGSSEDPGGDSRSVPSTDPEIVAALQAAANQVQQLALRYNAVGQTFPSLRARLATGVKYHASHLARLTELGGLQSPQPGKLPPLPKRSVKALAELAGREQALALAHATAAAKLSGQAARLLASIAASESQLAATLTMKAAT
jgi:hypothetical protein